MSVGVQVEPFVSTGCIPCTSTRSSSFGFSSGERVGWVTSDQDVPLGSHGVVIDFTADEIVVKFDFGEYLFPPAVVYRVDEEAGGFKCGDAVRWEIADEYKSDVPDGSVGRVTGAQNDKVIVNFGARQLLLTSADLCLVPGLPNT